MKRSVTLLLCLLFIFTFTISCKKETEKTKEGIEGKVTIFKPYSHIRLTWKPKNWTTFSSLQIRVIDSKGKSTISFHQDKLLDSQQRAEMKIYWSKVIAKIGSELIN